MNRYFLLSIAFFAMGVGAFSQTSPPASSNVTPPAPPFIVFPKFTAYDVDFKSAAGKPPVTDIVKLEVIDTGEVRQETEVRRDGRRIGRWYAEGVILVQNTADGSFFGIGERTARPGERSRFTPGEFRWASEKTFAGVVTYRGRKCNKFLKGGVTSASANAENKQPEEGAPGTMLVDAETHLPVVFWDGAILAVFTFKQPPADFQVPQNIKDQLTRTKLLM